MSNNAMLAAAMREAGLSQALADSADAPKPVAPGTMNTYGDPIGYTPDSGPSLAGMYGRGEPNTTMAPSFSDPSAGQYSAPKATLQATPLGSGSSGSSGSGGFKDDYGNTYGSQSAADAGQDHIQDSGSDSGPSGPSGGDGSSGNSRGGYIKSKTNRNVEHALKLVSSNKKSSPKKKNDINRAMNIARSAGRR
jgi:hypothetical protein